MPNTMLPKTTPPPAPSPIQPTQPIHSGHPPLTENMATEKVRFWSFMDPDRSPHGGAPAPSVHSLSYRAGACSIGCQGTSRVAAPKARWKSSRLPDPVRLFCRSVVDILWMPVESFQPSNPFNRPTLGLHPNSINSSPD